jgi:hypothetical protein
MRTAGKTAVGNVRARNMPGSLMLIKAKAVWSGCRTGRPRVIPLGRTLCPSNALRLMMPAYADAQTASAYAGN